MEPCEFRLASKNLNNCTEALARGPLTIFGPSAAAWDDALDPWLVTDWSHQSAFTSFHHELSKPPPPLDTILLNGTGKSERMLNVKSDLPFF